MYILVTKIIYLSNIGPCSNTTFLALILLFQKLCSIDYDQSLVYIYIELYYDNHSSNLSFNLSIGSNTSLRFKVNLGELVWHMIIFGQIVLAQMLTKYQQQGYMYVQKLSFKSEYL